MRHCLLNLLLVCCSLSASYAQTGEKTLEKMYRTYAGNWCNTLTFVQRTENYQNDSLTKISTWYETIAYPGQFRIDFGDPAKGNATLFLGDSVFTFRKGALLRKDYRVNDLIFLLGGMYFHPLEKVKTLFKEFGFDLSKGHESTWKGKAVYVIGAMSGDETSNQLWIEKERLILLRMIKQENGQKEEGIFEDHIRTGKGWTETKIAFYLDGKLFQLEYYNDVKANVPITEGHFDPTLFGKVNHWKGAVPLIPRREIFAEPDKSTNVKLSKDGQIIAFPTPAGELNWISPDRPQAVQKISLPGNVMSWEWTYNNTLLAVCRVEAALKLIEYTPATATLSETPLPADVQSARIVHLSDRHPQQAVLFLQSPASDNNGPFLVNLSRDAASGASLSKIETGVGDFLEYHFDADFRVVAATRNNANAAHDLYRRTPDGGWKEVASYTWSESRFRFPPEAVVSVAPDGKTLYFTDREGSDKNSLKSLNLENGAVQVLYSPPHADLIPSGMTISRATGKPQAVVSYFGVMERHFLDESLREDFDYLKTVISGDVSFAGRSLDDRYWLLRDFFGGPAVAYHYDRKERRVTRLFSEHTPLDAYTLSVRKPFLVKAQDGLELPSMIFLPPGSDQNNDGIPDKLLPTILYVHGGPWIGYYQNIWFINRQLQLLANRGYAVINAEFRGASGYGQAFIEASTREWGGKMHQDLVDIAKAAIARGVALPQKVGIFGWSYGGYAAFAAMAFAPDVFACGISMYGLGDLEAAFKHPFTSGPYWRQRIGNPDVPEELALIRRHSPINYIKQIKNPLLISHGSLDERVPQSQSDNMAKALKAAGKDVIYYYYPEEGHDYAQPENWQSFWAIGERFLQEHLGGRCEPAGVDLKQPNFKLVEWATKLPDWKGWR